MNLDIKYIFILGFIIPISLALPDLSKTELDPIVVNIQETAALTCNVKNLEKFTVIWKRMKYGRVEVLSANTLLVTNDRRITVMHSGDDWVLMVNEARVSDSGQYLCEINSVPIVQVSLFLTVKSLAGDSSFSLNHNYTACCIQQDVPDSCLGFCSLHNIVLGTTGTSPQNCKEHLPVIAGCMADGRNHTPCCIRERIPEMCRDICVGKFGIMNETIVHHYACSRFSRVMLACIAEGIEILPGPPQEVQVEPLSENEIKISWKQPLQNLNTITHYILNVTELSSFDENSFPVVILDYDLNPNDTEREDPLLPSSFDPIDKFREIKIANSSTSTVINNLKPFTMYEIYLISVNPHGSSLPTYRLRTLTLTPNSTDSSTLENATAPSLPDIRGCCAAKGMTQERCLNLFCDPVKTDLTNLTDVMICAPWISASVTCLTGGIDHTPCCRQRGLPELCISLCHGNISRIDFKFFRCVAYMNSYTSCLMQGYGVLSSAPMEPFVKNIHSNWVILQWNPPIKLALTVTSYNIHYKILSAMDAPYIVKSTMKSPYLLDQLESDSEYEVYISAVNQYGTSEGSPRVVFQTLPGQQLSSETSSSSSASHNLTDCCIRSQLNNTCMPLCNYRAKMADLQRLASVCMSDFHKLLKCGVAGRNHMPCCMRRMVNVNCASMCAGMVSQISSTTATMCIPYIPDIIHCMEEGNEKLPGPIRELHAVGMNKTTLNLEWDPPLNSSVILYEIHYQGEAMNSTNDKNMDQVEKVVNVTETDGIIDDLELGILYSVYVVAVNEYGSSMPSSILTFHTGLTQKTLTGVVSPPHSLMVRVRNVTSLKIAWLPPDFSHPSDKIDYNVYYKMSNESEHVNLTTSDLNALLQNLAPNTEYTIYVTALTEKGESWPSETLKAWTDTIYPAFVEIPRIHPSIQIEEGSSVTVLCVASGTPIPSVGVYINGVKIYEEITRHMVAVVSNISRTIDTIMCTANNGYGPGSHAVKHIRVSFSPKLEARAHVFGKVGKRAVLECVVNGYPHPVMNWWKDANRQTPIISDNNFVSRIIETTDSEDLIMQLIISKPSPEDEGPYFCSANNPYGNVIDQVQLELEKPEELPANVSECCREQNVIPECLEACTFDIDVDAIIDNPRCTTEISKFMYCAADNSDHRRCCHTWGIPRRCIGLCQGKTVQNAPLCVFAWGRQIIKCFQEGKYALPGIPRNVKLQKLSDTKVHIEWEPPAKNPQIVQYYRVFGKTIGLGRNDKFQNDTHGLSMTIVGLKPNAEYEFVVKSGNHYGASFTSNPMRVSLLNQDAEASAYDSSGNSAAIAIGVILTIIILAIAAVAAFVFLRRRYRPNSLGGISFENPSYMRETGDTSQANGPQEQGSSNVIPPDHSWKSEILHSVDNPDNLYEMPSGNKTNSRNKTNLQ